MSDAVVCLASASPRRRELLLQIGVAHRAQPAALDESPRDGERPADYVVRLAREKARQVAADSTLSGGLPVLGADTTVVVDGALLGKPADAVQGLQMLRMLSGREHEVLSGVVLRREGGAEQARLSTTRVRMREIGELEARAYWDSGEPRDKAGGYAVQGLAAAFIERIEGSYSGVMGLPLFETAELLRAAGIPIWGPVP